MFLYLYMWSSNVKFILYVLYTSTNESRFEKFRIYFLDFLCGTWVFPLERPWTPTNLNNFAANLYSMEILLFHTWKLLFTEFFDKRNRLELDFRWKRKFSEVHGSFDDNVEFLQILTNTSQFIEFWSFLRKYL